MAAATSSLKINAHPYGIDNTQRRIIVNGICTLSASGTYTNPGGVPLSWAFTDAQGNPATIPQVSAAQIAAGPVSAFFFSTASGQYNYGYNKAGNGLVIGSGGTQLANAAAITADTIGFEAEFVREY